MVQAHPLMRLRKYHSFYARRLAALREYTLDFLGGLWLLPVEVLLVVLIWRAIYAYTGPLGDFQLDQMIAYQLLVYSLLRGMGSVGTFNYRMWQDIRRGKLDIYLARPVDYHLASLCAEFGEVSIRLVAQLLAFLLTSVVLGLPILADPLLWVLFLAAALGGFVISFSIQFLIAAAAFWTEAIFGVRDLVLMISQLLSGALIPISLYPGLAARLASLLPFQYILYVPSTLYLARFTPAEAAQALGLQALWIVVLVLACRLVWRRGLARYEAYGG